MSFWPHAAGTFRNAPKSFRCGKIIGARNRGMTADWRYDDDAFDQGRKDHCRRVGI